MINFVEFGFDAKGVDMPGTFWISLLITVLFSIATLAICLVLGWKRGAFNSGIRLVFFLIAGISSFFFCYALASVLAPYIYELGKAWLILFVGEEIAALASVEELVMSIVTSLLAPLCYLVLFFVVDKILLIPYEIIRRSCADVACLHWFSEPAPETPVLVETEAVEKDSLDDPMSEVIVTEPAKPKRAAVAVRKVAVQDRVIGLILGLILALGIVFVTFMPFSGYARFSDNMIDTYADLGYDLDNELLEQAAGISSDPLLTADAVCGGEALFYTCAKDLKVDMEAVHTIILSLDYFDAVSKGGLSTAEGVGQLSEIFDGLSPQAAQIIDDILVETGTETDVLELPVARTAGQVFISFSQLSGDLDEDEFTKELALVNYMFSALVLGSEVKVNEYIEMLGHSKVISRMVIDAADPSSPNHSVAQTIVEGLESVDKSEVKNAMDKFYNMYMTNAALLNAIASLLNIDVQY